MRNKLSEFEVEINDIITPLSCSSMIIEFIKYIIYQKQLIPYPYERLKMYVDKRKDQLESMKEDSQPFSRTKNSQYYLTSEKYFKKTLEAYNSLENIFKLIQKELTFSPHNTVDEVIILLGTSFLNPQDVFRFCIPSLNYAHKDENHSARKNWRNLFKTIINSEKFYDITSNTNCSSSLQIMIKMKADHFSTHSDLFIPRNGFKLPSKGNQAIISFKTAEKEPDCLCFQLKVFEDDSASDCSSSQSHENSQNSDSMTRNENSTSNGNNCWYQIKDILHYFSDVSINGVSVTDIWMNPMLLRDQ